MERTAGAGAGSVKKILAAVAAVGIFACALWRPAAADFPKVVAELQESVVGVGTFQAIRQPQIALRGTGFVVGDGRHVITNDHVIRDKVDEVDLEYLVVTVGRGTAIDVRRIEVKQRDAEHDLALLAFEGARLPTVELREALETVPEGSDIAVTGYPLGPVLGLYPVTHRGIVSAVSPLVIPQPNARTLDTATIIRHRFNVYQLDLIAYPGNSGSPLYDSRTGEVIGVLNSTFVKETRESAISSPSGISYAIPSIYAVQLLRRAQLR